MMNRKGPKKTIYLIFAVVWLTCVASCDWVKSITGDDDDGGSSIPEAVLELADGIFNLIDSIFESDYDDPTTDPALNAGGLSLAWISKDVSLRLTLTDFSPPDSGGVVANGSIVLTRTTADPLSMTITVGLTLSNHTYTNVSVAGAATWAPGQDDPSDGDPESITGTFTVDGTEYGLAEILEGIENLDAADDGDNDGGIPAAMTPVPDTMWNKSYYQLLKRPAAGGAWESEKEAKMDFNSAGTGWGLEGGTKAGYVHWYAEAGAQKMDFYDINKTEKLYSFTVLLYGATELHLSGTWKSVDQQLYFNVDSNFLGPYPN